MLCKEGIIKRIIEIWAESTKFYTSQRLANLAWLIVEKDWLSNLEILGIRGQVNREEYTQNKPHPNELKNKILKTKSTLNPGPQHQY